MKKSHLLLMMFIVCASLTELSSKPLNKILQSSDTAKQPHVIDGSISEWTAVPFTTDKETLIGMAVDNDNSQLYVALIIASQNTQMRLMKFGMNLFVDLKGKHREGTNIEFPIKNTSPGISQGNGAQRDITNKPAQPDPAEIRKQFGMRLLFMKLFGFEGLENDKTLGLSNENGANVAFTWDDANVMYIEYAIPISSLGTIANLTGKKISVGLKLNVPDIPVQGQRTATGTTSGIVAVPSGSSTKVSTGRTPNLVDQTSSFSSSSQNSLQEIYIWNKYDMKF